MNHVAVETTSEAPNVVLGTFLINSHPATVLFDTGATHSFIVNSFVERHRLPVSTMARDMVVTSPGGNLRTNTFCPRVRVDIRGVEFCTKLIVVDSKGIEVILGMETLTKWGVRIDCARRTVLLASSVGQEVEISALGPSGYLHQMDVKPIDGIRVVCEFPDVFPDELPGMPPNREIEFLIEL